MKKFNIIKILQLVLMLAFLAVCAYLMFVKRGLFHDVAQDPDLRMVSGMLWACFALEFIFIFVDFGIFSDYKRDYRELDFAVHSDPLSGLANRNGCDAMIERYLRQPLPKGVGCVMFDLTNIQEINKKFSHLDGNALIRDFSNILKMASVSLCFVGRNGGNKFLAVFEESTPEQADKFLQRIRQKVEVYNAGSPEKTIEYAYGVAFDETVKDITELIALANRRIKDPNA